MFSGIGYKIFKRTQAGNLAFIFHGLNGVRQVNLGIEYKAIKRKVIDGKGGRSYLSGFHLFLVRKHAEEWLRRYESSEREIVEVEFKQGRKKETNKSIILADSFLIHT